MKANMTPKTASKYIQSGELPSTQVKDRDWRTRDDPFEAIWPEVKARLEEASELQGKALFEWFCEQVSGAVSGGATTDFSAQD